MEKDKKIKISVVLTTRNRKYEIARALSCVMEQTFAPYEIILIDDASDDGTKKYLADSLDLTSVVYIKNEERAGVGASRNTGINVAKGDYIAFLDSDNEWEKNKLEVFAGYLHKENNLDFVCSRYEKRVEFKLVFLPEGITKSKVCGNSDIFMFNPADASATVYKKEFLEQSGGFLEGSDADIDWEILLRAARTKELRFCMIPEVLSRNWTMYDGLMSHTDVRLRAWIELLKTYQEEILSQSLGFEAFNQFIIQNRHLLSEQQTRQMFFETFCNEIRWQNCIYNHYQSQLAEKQQQVYKKNSFYEFVRTWLETKINGKDISDTLFARGIKSVAIYGFGIHGRLLYSDLVQSEKIKVLYVIDKERDNLSDKPEIQVLSLEDKLPAVDAIIVTPYLQFDMIKTELEKLCTYQLIPINDIVQQSRE